MSKIEVNEIVNQSGDNDSGIDLTTNNQIAFKIANASKWTLNSSGNLFPASTSQGIVLGATSDTEANRLDDYEVGTFSPTLENQGNSNLSTTKRSNNNGAYVKVGSAVHFQMLIYISALSGDDSSNLQVANMPFIGKSSATHAGYGGGICTYAAAVDVNPTYALVLDDSDNMRIYTSPTQPMISSNLQASSYIVIFGYYETSA